MWLQKRFWSATHNWPWTIQQWPNLDFSSDFFSPKYPRTWLGPWEMPSKARFPTLFFFFFFLHQVFAWKSSSGSPPMKLGSNQSRSCLVQTPGAHTCSLMGFWKALKYLPFPLQSCAFTEFRWVQDASETNTHMFRINSGFITSAAPHSSRPGSRHNSLNNRTNHLGPYL